MDGFNEYWEFTQVLTGKISNQVLFAEQLLCVLS